MQQITESQAATWAGFFFLLSRQGHLNPLTIAAVDTSERDKEYTHADLYHKLGRMEALLETMMSNLSSSQVAIKDIHTRIDGVEARQNTIERLTSSTSGATSALTGLAKDFAIPIMTIVIAWLVAREQVTDNMKPKPVSLLEPQSMNYIKPAISCHHHKQKINPNNFV